MTIEASKDLNGRNPSLSGNDLVVAARRETERAAREAFGTWLDEVAPWGLFVTMTFKPPTEEEARRGYDRRGWAYAKRAWRDFEQQALDVADIPTVRSVAVLELHGSGIPHVHALIAGPRTASAMVLQEKAQVLQRWATDKYGFARVLPYDPGEGAAGYLGKYLVKGNAEFIDPEESADPGAAAPVTPPTPPRYGGGLVAAAMERWDNLEYEVVDKGER